MKTDMLKQMPKLKNCFTVLCSAAVVTVAADQPNVVLVLLDDVGTGWIPPYADRLAPVDVEELIVKDYAEKRNKGVPVDVEKHLQAARNCMPLLSKLADEGAVFDRCFASASLCAPSRAGLLTGTFQQRWGAYSLTDVDQYGIPTNKVVLAEPFKAAGYRCGMIGKWHVAKKDESIKDRIWTEKLGESLPIPSGSKGRWPEIKKHLEETAYESSAAPGQHPLDRGFDYYFGYNSHGDYYYGSDTLWENHERVPKRPSGEFLIDLFNEKADAFVESALKEKKPFFLYYAPMTLHGGIKPPPVHYSEPFDTGVKFSDEYAGHLRALDEGLRKIFQTLEKNGQAGNTLFILSCDNGCTLYNVPPYNAPNRGGKGTGWLGGVNVPLIVWKPGLVKPEVNREIVSLIDVMPTVLESAGLSVPSGIDGRSLLPFLRGDTDCGPRNSICSSGLHASHWSYFYEGEGEVNKKDGAQAPLYVWRLEGDKLLMRITETKPGLYQSLPNGLASRTLLYDLAADRQQMKDLHQKYPEQVKELDRGIHEWMTGMQEPLTGQQADYQILLEKTQ